MRALWLADVLRAASLIVREVSGWRERGSSEWGPDTSNPSYRMPLQGVVCHATAGGRGARAEDEIRVLLNGSTTAPPPIAQLYLARDGTYHVVASGRCNHALTGWAGPLKGYGNYQLIGIEAGNDNRGEPWPAVQLDAYYWGVAALCRKLDVPASRVAGHKEHQPYPPPPWTTSTKSDPVGIDMAQFRRRVAALIEEDDMSAAEVWQYEIRNPNTGKNQAAEERFMAMATKVHQLSKVGPELLAGHAAILAAVGGEDVAATVRAELDRHRPLVVAELVEILGPVLVEELRTAAADLPAEAAEAVAEVVDGAVERALSRTSLTVAPADDGS